MFKKMSLQRVIERWRDENLTLLAPLEEREVIETLSGTGHHISRDVIELYCATGGMTGDEMASTMFNLWSLDRVVSENEKHGGAMLLFADFLIDSYCYRLKYENERESSVHVDYFDGQILKVANSLDEFFHLYLTDPLKIELMRA